MAPIRPPSFALDLPSAPVVSLRGIGLIRETLPPRLWGARGGDLALDFPVSSCRFSPSEPTSRNTGARDHKAQGGRTSGGAGQGRRAQEVHHGLWWGSRLHLPRSDERQSSGRRPSMTPRAPPLRRMAAPSREGRLDRAHRASAEGTGDFPEVIREHAILEDPQARSPRERRTAM